MAAVTPIPFAIGLLVAVGLFVALTYYLVQESRRPVHWPAPKAPGHHPSHTRVAAVCVVFTVWSLWATARPVSGWR
jgi:hypothetical protein